MSNSKAIKTPQNMGFLGNGFSKTGNYRGIFRQFFQKTRFFPYFVALSHCNFAWVGT
jgi:hypothetical protein